MDDTSPAATNREEDRVGNAGQQSVASPSLATRAQQAGAAKRSSGDVGHFRSMMTLTAPWFGKESVSPPVYFATNRAR